MLSTTYDQHKIKVPSCWQANVLLQGTHKPIHRLPPRVKQKSIQEMDAVILKKEIYYY